MTKSLWFHIFSFLSLILHSIHIYGDSVPCSPHLPLGTFLPFCTFNLKSQSQFTFPNRLRSKWSFHLFLSRLLFFNSHCLSHCLSHSLSLSLSLSHYLSLILTMSLHVSIFQTISHSHRCFSLFLQAKRTKNRNMKNRFN